MASMGFGPSLSLARRGRGFSPARLFAGGTAGCWFDPGDMSTMFQDSAGTVPAAVGSPIGLIRDKSGRGNHGLQSLAAARPMLRQSEAGRLFIEFDGVDDRLVATFAIAQPFERVSAVRQLGWASGQVIFGSSSGDTGRLFQAPSSPSVRLFSDLAGPATPDLPIGVDGVVSERFDGAASRIAVNHAAPVTGNAGSSAPAALSMGARGTGSGPTSLRLYGIVMIGRLLGDGEARRLRSFMAARAGLAL